MANTCGINPRLMADILADMGMSVGKLSLPGKTKEKKKFLGGASVAGTDADLEAELKELKIAARIEMDKKTRERFANAPKSVKKGAVGAGEAAGADGLTSLQEMVEKQAGTHKSVLQDFRWK